MGLLVIVAKAMMYNKDDHLPNWHPPIASLLMADKQLLLCPDSFIPCSLGARVRTVTFPKGQADWIASKNEYGVRNRWHFRTQWLLKYEEWFSIPYFQRVTQKRNSFSSNLSSTMSCSLCLAWIIAWDLWLKLTHPLSWERAGKMCLRIYTHPVDLVQCIFFSSLQAVASLSTSHNVHINRDLKLWRWKRQRRRTAPWNDWIRNVIHGKFKSEAHATVDDEFPM